ncbi:hypothetical protein Ahy_B08g092661 [Arachis hypogaea]|uniref:Aminotransferase-like plant mobile domain-containing protein n=1 Tax=Arachis hypogaea TaxID=3818 RepID=A0A444Y4E2_ARAHY|nr:hypothetical protein Ahy_B08g092661 [Arachis hypogaea]
MSGDARYPTACVLLLYIRKVGFGHVVELRDFIFNNALLFVFAEWWRPETYTFHLPWGEVTITLQDVAYHLGLCTDGNPISGCTKDFQQIHPKDKWQVFGLRMTWLKNRVTHIPPGADADTLCQYARCYLLMLIGVFFFTDKSANLLPLRWLSLLEDFDACRRLSWGSALLSHTYHSLALPELVMSWIYHSEVNQHCQYWDCFGY